MNPHDKHRHDNPVDEREWQAQERARLEARTGTHPPDAAADMAARRVADALRRPPADGLPADFAARVARLALSQPHAEAADARFETILLRWLVALFVAGALVTLAVYGGTLAAQLRPALGVEGPAWASALAACAGLSWALDRMLRSLRRDEDPLQAA